jgi:hypothetical protein
MGLQLLAPVANSVPFPQALHFSAKRSLRPHARHILAQQTGFLWDIAARFRNAVRNSDLSDDEQTTRPGVIRTHDQGIMSGDEPEE